jgi:hypothetical protein
MAAAAVQEVRGVMLPPLQQTARVVLVQHLQ